MASKFMSDMPLAGMEAQMQQVPGFRPRKCGMSVSRLELTQARGAAAGRRKGRETAGRQAGAGPAAALEAAVGAFPASSDVLPMK